MVIGVTETGNKATHVQGPFSRRELTVGFWLLFSKAVRLVLGTQRSLVTVRLWVES